MLKTKVHKNETNNDNSETKVDNNHLAAESSINNLKTKVNGTDLTKYVLKSDYDTKVGNLELKIPDISGKLKKTAESKLDISGLTSKAELKNVENKVPDVNGFVKRTDCDTEISSIKNDYVTMSLKISTHS